MQGQSLIAKKQKATFDIHLKVLSNLGNSINLGEDISTGKKGHWRPPQAYESIQNNRQDAEKSLNRIEEALESHICFEERILFRAIQEVATPLQLERVPSLHRENGFAENTADEFWR